MFGIFNSVPLSIANPFKDVSLDDGASHLNRIYLFIFCIIAGTLVTVNEYAGEKIVCHGFVKFEDAKFVNNYCWCQGIYTIKEAYDLYNQLPYPGIIPADIPCFDFTYKNGTRYRCPDESQIMPLTHVKHLWYQWVPFYFWICAVFFYLPYIIFKQSDIGNLKQLVQLLTDKIDDDEEENKKINKASLWLANKLNEYRTAEGGLRYFLVRHKLFFVILFTKIANLLTVITVLLLTDRIFVIGSFLTYGSDWIQYIRSDGTDGEDNPVDKLFPKMVACEIKQWGTTGIDEENGMCVLAPNVVNSFSFIIFWFVLMLALIANIISVLFSTTTQLFTLGRWNALMSSTFMTNCTKRERKVFFSSGTSGQITLAIIARNVSARTFEKLYKRVCSRLVVSDSNSLPGDRGLIPRVESDL